MSLTVVFGASPNFDFSPKLGFNETAGSPLIISFSGGGVWEDNFPPAGSLDAGAVVEGSLSSSASSDVRLIFFLTHRSDGSIAGAA